MNRITIASIPEQQSTNPGLDLGSKRFPNDLNNVLVGDKYRESSRLLHDINETSSTVCWPLPSQAKHFSPASKQQIDINIERSLSYAVWKILPVQTVTNRCNVFSFVSNNKMAALSPVFQCLSSHPGDIADTDNTTSRSRADSKCLENFTLVHQHAFQM